MNIGFIKIFLHKIFYVYSSSVINGLLGIVLIRYMIGKIGFSGYGIYSTYTIGQSYLLLLDSSVSRSLVRKFIEDKDSKETFQDHYSAFVIVSIFLGFFIPLIVVYGYLTHIAGLQRTIICVIFVIIFEFLGNTVVTLRQSYRIASEDFKATSLFALISGLVKYLLIFIVLYFDKPVLWVVFSMLVKKVLEIFLAYKIYKLPFFGDLRTVNFKKGFLVLRESVVITFAQISQTALITIPAIVAGRVLGVEGLGIFRSMFDLASRVWFLSNGLGLILFPLFAKLKSRIDARILRSLAFVNSLSLLGYLALIVLGTIFSDALVTFLRLDNKFSVTIVVVMIGMFINAHSNAMYELMQSFGKPMFIVISASIGLLPYLSFSISNTASIDSVALVWAISQIVFLIVLDLFYLKLFGVSKYTLLKSFGTAIGCVCFISVYYVQTGHGLLFIVSGSVIAAIVFGFASAHKGFKEYRSVS